MKIVQISDTHLTHRGGVTNRNFELLADFVNDVLRPDLIVNSGDISLLSPDSAEDRRTARELHQRFDAPVRFLPGNHDVGEPGESPWAGFNVTSERIGAHRSVFGPDFWVDTTFDTAVIGLNSEVLSSGLPEEQEQWDWLGGVRSLVGDRPALLFLHKPLWSPIAGKSSHALCVIEPDRLRILSALQGVKLQAVGSGHLHQYRLGAQEGITTVSAPSTAFIAKSVALGEGLHQLGVVEYRCESDEAIPLFRSATTLNECEPWNQPEFSAAWQEIGAGPLPKAA